MYSTIVLDSESNQGNRGNIVDFYILCEGIEALLLVQQWAHDFGE
jgi:hypothetical protein